MYTTLPLLLISLIGTGGLLAQPNTPVGNLLTPKDSVLLTINNSQKLIHHIVKPKQTLFSLAKYYGLSLEELYALHPEFQTNPALRAGTLVSIPIPNRAIRRYKGMNFDPAKFAPIYYVVQPGDNLFQICKRHFSMPVDSIRVRNNMRNEQIKPGQLLLIGWMGLEGISADWRTPAAPPITGQTHQLRYDEEKKARNEIITQGVCFWQRDSNEKGDLYALHREANIGTVMAVNNPMSRRTVYAKVIGRIPAGYGSNIEVVLSPAAARQIGARDPRFFVKIRYLK
ncbi:MAG: LysM peptidoglycan-binding domain-containing protein [Saprospiraceae bacterium]